MPAIGPFRVARTRQGGDPAEVGRYTDPTEAETAARLLRDVGDRTAHVEVVPADELEQQLNGGGA